MIIGIPKELKNNEFRVSATPSGVHALVQAGHQVIVESGAGIGSAITDSNFISVGARITESVEDLWREAELILKVKEPLPI